VAIGAPWDEVGERCYRRRYESYDLNVGVVRGADALLLLDTRCHAGEVGELLDDLRVFGTRPITRPCARSRRAPRSGATA
jgi:hypothetical protein